MSKKGKVKIIKATKGYFLTIGDPDFKGVENTWAVTKEELLELKSKLNNLFKGKGK